MVMEYHCLARFGVSPFHQLSLMSLNRVELEEEKHQHVNGRCAPGPAQRNTGVMKNKSVQKIVCPIYS